MSSIDVGVITPNTPPPSSTDATEKVATSTQVVLETVLEEVVAKAEEALPAPLVAVIEKVVAEVSEVPEVAAILRHVPKFVSAVHTLTDRPGSEKKALVLTGLHALAAKLETTDKITAEFRASLDAFVDTVVPVTIDALLDVVKGRVSFETVTTAIMADPAKVAAVAATALTCCMGFMKACKKSKAPTEAAAEVAAPTAA